MKLRLIMADPAGNRTALVLSPVPAGARGELAGRIMALPGLQAEQVGYCCPPRGGEALGRLEMMGGEFCGNAARSFGLMLARERGLAAAAVEVSGSPRPLLVEAGPAGDTAACPMPLPGGIGELAVPELSPRPLPAVRIGGITHVIAPGIPPVGESFLAIRRAADSRWDWEALGGMFLGEDGAMTPVVAVRGSGTTVRESSCASGTAAAAVWLSREQGDGMWAYAIRQPGGVITARVLRAGGAVAGVTVDGPVVLEPPREVEL